MHHLYHLLTSRLCLQESLYQTLHQPSTTSPPSFDLDPPSPQVESPPPMVTAFADAFNAISTQPPNSSSSRGRKKEKIEAPTRNKDTLGLVLGGKLRYTVGRDQQQQQQSIVGSSKSHDGIGRGGRSTSPLPIPPVPEIPSSYRHGGAPSIRSTRTTSSASSGSSTYTRFSNASLRSVSTTGTSVSSGSNDWRRKKLPGNIKPMTGIPWELGEVPRQQYPRPDKHVFSSAPAAHEKPRRHHHHQNSQTHGSAKLAMELTTIAEGSRPSSGKDRPSEQQQLLQQYDNRRNPGLMIDLTAANNNEGTGVVDKPLKTPTKSRSIFSWRSNK